MRSGIAVRMRARERKEEKGGGRGGMAQMVLFYPAMCRSVYLDARSFLLSSYRAAHNHKYPNS